MPLKNFIKENFVLVVGLALPVLLVIGFLAASILPQSNAVPPQYEMLFTTTRYDQASSTPYNAEFLVKHGRLVARVWKNRPNTGSYAKKLMAYNGKTQSVREITYDLSKIGDVADYTEVSLEELSALHVNNATTSPDGYVFETAGYHGGWPITEIFGGGYHDRRARLVKGSAVFKLPENNGSLYNYYDTQFLGWVVPPQAEPAHEQ